MISQSIETVAINDLCGFLTVLKWSYYVSQNNKTLMPEMSYLFWSCWPVRSYRLSNITYRLLLMLLDYPSDLDSKTPHTWVIEYREIKQVLTWKLHLYWLAFIVLEASMHVTRVKKQLPILQNEKDVDHFLLGKNLLRVCHLFFIGNKHCGNVINR